jgi:hypothetical protein
VGIGVGVDRVGGVCVPSEILARVIAEIVVLVIQVFVEVLSEIQV